MRTQRLIATLATAAALLGLVACGDDSDDSGNGSKPKPPEPPGQTTGPNGEEATPTSALKLSTEEIEQVKAGGYTAALTWHQSSDFTTAVTAGAEDEFAKLGIDIVATTNANLDPGKQKNDIETVLAKRPSVMLTLPVDPVTTASAYRAATRAGTKLVLLSNVPKGFSHGEDYVAVVTDDLFQMGKQAADALAAAIGNEGKVAYFFHDASYYVTNQRDLAFWRSRRRSRPTTRRSRSSPRRVLPIPTRRRTRRTPPC
jgi:ribose transport system substrate-binding protein